MERLLLVVVVSWLDISANRPRKKRCKKDRYRSERCADRKIRYRSKRCADRVVWWYRQWVYNPEGTCCLPLFLCACCCLFLITFLSVHPTLGTLGTGHHGRIAWDLLITLPSFRDHKCRIDHISSWLRLVVVHYRDLAS